MRARPSLRIRSLAPAMVLAATLLAAPGASAATVGSDLSGPPDSGFGCATPASTCTAAVTTPGGDYVSPIDGVVTHWHFKSAGNGAGAPLSLRILHPGAVAGTFIGAGTSTEFLTPAVPGTFPVDTRLPIQAGDRIGLQANFSTINVTHALAGHTMSIWNPVLPDTGSAIAPSSSLAWDLLVNADVEPDADHDGYGDQTQDLCPSDVSTHAACPVATTPPAVANPKKKCKKKKHKRAGTAAKKKKKCRHKKGK